MYFHQLIMLQLYCFQVNEHIKLKLYRCDISLHWPELRCLYSSLQQSVHSFEDTLSAGSAGHGETQGTDMKKTVPGADGLAKW